MERLPFFDIVYRLQVGMEIPGLEVLADASLGDPLSLQGQALVVSTTPVPLPAAAWLLLSGLATMRFSRTAAARR